MRMVTGAGFTNPDELHLWPARRTAAAALVGTLAALLLLAVLVEVITLLAQGVSRDELRAYGDPVYLYSLPKHVLAMVLLAGFAVAIATLAALRRLGWLAVAVLVATATGPMVLVAAPARAGLMTADFTVVGWWRPIVTLAVLAILSTATWWNVRCLRTAPAGERSPDQHTSVPFSLASLAPGSVFVVLTMAGAVGQLVLRYDPNGEEPSLSTIIGWSVLAAACVTLTVQLERPAIGMALLLGTALTQAAMYLAYFRPGGWPGVAGWDAFTSPVILSPVATIMLLAAPLLPLLPTLIPRAKGVPDAIA